MSTGGYLPNALSSHQVNLTETTFMVPFDRDLKFVGRTDVIQQIDNGFTLQRRVALHGIGGIG